MTKEITRYRVSADALWGGNETQYETVVSADDYDAMASEIERLQADLDLLMRCGYIVRESAIDGHRFVEARSPVEPSGDI